MPDSWEKQKKRVQKTQEDHKRRAEEAQRRTQLRNECRGTTKGTKKRLN
jgi:hypothetical protein